MIHRYRYGKPVKTEATVVTVKQEAGAPAPFHAEKEGAKQVLRYTMGKEDAVYGLGEQVRGMNKRGWIYEGWNTDDPIITESRTALYGAHNFFVVVGEKIFGLFVDCAEKVVFDLGYTDRDEMKIVFENADVYLIEGESALAVVHEFRTLIGQSYIPPKWAFGYGQSRWGYKSEEEIRAVAKEYAKNGMPLDMIYLDIDYMDAYKDFTVHPERFPDLKKLSADLKAEGIYLVPIIDAAVKVEKGYSVYDEGVAKGYFCKDASGAPYVVGVWPGESVLPDVLSPEARAWFGSQYKTLLDQGIEGFWNDMNEPAMFYGKDRLQAALTFAASARGKNLDTAAYSEVTGALGTLANNLEDYRSFYHETPEGKYTHEKTHNLYGYNMTRAAAEYFGIYRPDRRYLLFSRSSYIGMHRYGGIWTGDNSSWWSHLLLNLQMMPALDMCGFLFAGADLGGHGGNTTEELLLRWLALGIFTPLMRNHATNGSREQECYRFKDKEAFKNILGIRYSILPYLYSEFVKCARGGEMLFKPLAFVYPHDSRAKTVEDQLIVGGSIMIAPVYEQNAAGRYVYLPERMKLIRMRSGTEYSQQILEKGEYYIPVPLNEVVFFLREGCVMPLARPSINVDSLDDTRLTWLKFIEKPTAYILCRDDGFTGSGLDRAFFSYTIEP